MDGQTNGLMNGQTERTHRWTDKKADGWIYIWAYRWTDEWKDRVTNGHKNV